MYELLLIVCSINIQGILSNHQRCLINVGYNMLSLLLVTVIQYDYCLAILNKTFQQKWESTVEVTFSLSM